MSFINQKSSKSPLRKLIVVLNLILIIVLVIGFLYYTDINKLLRVLASTRPIPFIFATALGMLMTVFMSIRLWVLIKKQGVEISLLQLVWINMGIRFYSFFSPISSIGAIMRWNRIVPPGKSAEGLAAIGVSRMFDLILGISVGVFWALTAANKDALNPFILIGYLIVLFIALLLSFKVSGIVARWAGERRANAWIYRALEKLANSFSLYSNLSASEILILLGSAVVGDLIGLVAHLLTAVALNIPISFADLGWIRAFGLLAAWTPFTLPGGLGMREASTIILMTGLGINVEQAVAFSLLLYARSLIVALIGGGIELGLNLSSFKK